MMVRMQISPAHPLPFTHRSEPRMSRKCEIARAGRKPFHGCCQCRPVLQEPERRSPPHLLVHFRRVGMSFGHAIGSRSAARRTSVRLIGVITSLAVFRPLASPKESCKWQTICCAFILPHPAGVSRDNLCSRLGRSRLVRASRINIKVRSDFSETSYAADILSSELQR